MTAIAIRAEGLGKSYRIGKRQERYRTFREAILQNLGAPLRRIRSVLRAEHAGDLGESVWALRNASFEVRPGEVLGVIGRNGAGKSTLLKILSRVTQPTEGHAELHGRVGSLLEVGTGFHPELTGRENVFLNGAILGMRRAEIRRKFDEIVAFAEVDRFIDTPVKRYSSGMYLRLAFAVAAHLEPEILVVDEVLAVGDASFQKKCMGKMESVAGEGRTILFVSHNLAAITSLCSRAILLQRGELHATGPATDIVASYLSDVTGAAASVVWPSLEEAPGTDGVKVMAVRLVDENGAPASSVDIERPVTLKVSYHIDAPRSFRIAAAFYTQGACAFTTLEPVETMRERPGHYESTVVIPGNMFAEGDYLLTLSGFASRGKKVHVFKLDGCIAFQVYDALTGASARGDYREGFGGHMRPKLAWNTRPVVDR
jgi:lipopolysaccharide transport system ATP-binding protein